MVDLEELDHRNYLSISMVSLSKNMPIGLQLQLFISSMFDFQSSQNMCQWKRRPQPYSEYRGLSEESFLYAEL